MKQDSVIVEKIIKHCQNAMKYASVLDDTISKDLGDIK